MPDSPPNSTRTQLGDVGDPSAFPANGAAGAPARPWSEIARLIGREPRLLLWPFRAGPRNVLAWIIALCLAASYVWHGWKLQGHVSCDFGGPWLLGRMLLLGEGDNLYLRQAGRDALATGYAGQNLKTVEREILGKSTSDIEGPLYPPTAGLLMAPVALLDPQACHAVLSLLFAQLMFVTAWLIRGLTDNRLRTGEIALLILAFPNSCQTLLLGQNAALTLTIITLGLVL